MVSQKDPKERVTSFTNAFNGMIATNDSAYKDTSFFGDRQNRERIKKYSIEEIYRIIESGSIREKISLSRNYFQGDGIYRRIIIYYATLLKYVGILIPSPAYNRSLSEDFVQKKYGVAMDFIDGIDIPTLSTNFAISALRDGCYYGVIQDVGKRNISILDLPTKYCVTRFKNKQNEDIIEFDTRYFDSISDEQAKKGALSVYPKPIVNWYKRYKNGKVKSPWVYIPTEISICLPFLDGLPNFLNMIPDAVEYDLAVDEDRERDAEEIRKIIVQKIPHLQGGELLFEPDEAKVMHDGAVKMMKGNPNISVMTTYGDVEAIVSKTSRDNNVNMITKALENVYNETGVSKQVFSSDSNLALETSIQNDMAMMMVFAFKISTLITNIVNNKYSNVNIKFTYKFLPVSYYNSNKFIETSFKLATSGYSFLLPMIAMGFSQKQLSDIKDLENTLMKLDEKLIPLSSAYTQSAEGRGRPAKENEDKSDKTIANEESLDKGGSK